MKKALLFILLLLAFSVSGIAQFSADLAGYPLVTTGWNVGGSAIVVDSTIQLTAAVANQGGYVYYNTPVNLTGCGEFTVDFDFKIKVTTASMVADGIAFWYISNPPTGFVSGGGIGLPSNPNGLLMIMDTYDNFAPVNVPLETLLGYDGTIVSYTEGSTAGLLAPVVGLQNFITDGTWHHVKITYNMGTVNVFFNYSAAASLTGSYPMSITGYFGLSSSTGAAFSTQSVKNVHISAAGAAVPPTLPSHSITYCQNDVASPLTATGTGPTSVITWYSTDTATVVSLPGAPTPNTAVTGSTWYFVRQSPAAGTCISVPDSVEVIVSPHPAAPVITGVTAYCSGMPAVPFTVSGTTGSLLWYTDATGGTGSSTPINTNTAIPGYQSVWVSQVVAGCEGPRDSIGVRVTTTPPVPAISGTTTYCQFVGPYDTVIPTLTPTGAALWYTAATGGTGLAAEPTVNITVAGVTTQYLSQRDSGCESSRLPVNIIVNPKPVPPTFTAPVYCQYNTASPLAATGNNIVWYGTGVTSGYTAAPTPQTLVPGTDSFYLTQASASGCVSDRAYYAVKIIPQPAPPAVTAIEYCRTATATALTAGGTGIKWYTVATGGTALGSAPVPPTSSAGPTTWFATQTVNGCESDRAPLMVDILYKPMFTVLTERSFVCQFDSITLTYSSPDPDPITYLWTAPNGAHFAANTNDHEPVVTISFDSANQANPVYFIATRTDGKCSSDTTININVVALPNAQAYSKPNACLGDTTSLSLSYRSATAGTYTWTVDNTPLASSAAVDIVTGNSNTGGPYLISWNTTGNHIIQLNTFTKEGCTSKPSFDTVDVHKAPDATFTILSKTDNICIEDSLELRANTADYSNTYLWLPEHSFDNVNKPTIWGKMEEARSDISLTVTDPFGCKSTYTQEIDPSSCCKVFFPNAFTPSASNKTNMTFRPVFAGMHNFHIFRVANRWGQTIFETTNNAPEWDGSYNGVPQDVGTYYYYVKFDCGGKVVEEKGDVILVR